jgi:hypothetical protein
VSNDSAEKPERASERRIFVMSRYRHLLELPPDEAWPEPEALLDRKALARLFKVPRETIRNWERAGLLPDRVPPPPGHVVEKGVTYISYRSADVREWVQKEGRIFRILPPIKPSFAAKGFAAKPSIDIEVEKLPPVGPIVSVAGAPQALDIDGGLGL